MLSELNLLSAFLIGLAGGVHCVGMCGGIAGAFTFAIPKGASLTPYVAAYNAGRIFSYTIAGAVTGLLGSIFSASILTGLAILQIISIVFLCLLALYISDVFKGLLIVEKGGAKLWTYLAPIGKRLIPFKNPFSGFAYGMVWGWLPCGLVYSALTWSLAAGSMQQGALVMLFFGLGTLPALIASSLGASFLLPLLQNIITRRLVAILLFTFALFLTFNLFHGIK